MKMTTLALITVVGGVGYAQAQGLYVAPSGVSQSDVANVVQSQVQSATALTDASGNWTAPWAFQSAPTTVVATIKNSAGNVYECPTTVISATSVSGRCYQIVSNTLPTAAPALLGLVVSPFANPGAGLTVTIIGKM